MKKFKKALCILLSVMLCAQFGSLCFGAGETTADYTIVNPYADVIWSGENAWGAYKGSLHSHTTYSDADYSLEVMVKESYARGYDFLAISDHGVTGVEWNEEPYRHPLYFYQPILGNEFKHLTDEEYEAIKNGTYDDRGYGMTPVLGANEFNNLSLTKNHVNGHFLEADMGNAFPGAENEHGYEQAISYIHENGGISYINHPGDWLDSNSNPDVVNEEKSIEFFSDLLLRYDSCLGIEILNERNGTTGYDRILWDNLLMYTLPYGKNVIGFSNTDAHHTGTVDTSFSVFMMEENTVENIKKTMQSGALFAITRKLRPNDVIGPAEEIDVSNTDLPYPMFSSLTVDGHKITAEVTDADTIQWIANGKIISKSTVNDANPVITLDLDTISGAENFDYVRVEIFGEGGLCISQAMVIDDGSAPLTFEADEPTFFESIVNIFRGSKIFAIIVELYRLIKG